MLLAPLLGLIYLYNDSTGQVADTKTAQVQGYSLGKHKDRTRTRVKPRQTQRQHKFKGTAYTNPKTTQYKDIAYKSTKTTQIHGYSPHKGYRLHKHKKLNTRSQLRQTQKHKISRYNNLIEGGSQLEGWSKDK
jgi:hypothetical protein